EIRRADGILGTAYRVSGVGLAGCEAEARLASWRRLGRHEPTLEKPHIPPQSREPKEHAAADRHYGLRLRWRRRGPALPCHPRAGRESVPRFHVSMFQLQPSRWLYLRPILCALWAILW